MPQSTDPDVRKYDGPGDLPPCPECHSFMLPLRDFQIQKSGESPSASAEGWELLVWGWWAIVGNTVSDLFTLKGRVSKLEQQKQEVLPSFPNSLVCPRCGHVLLRP